MSSPSRARNRGTATARPSQGPAHARSQRTHRAARVVGLVATAAIAFGAVGAASALTSIQGNIKHSTGLDLVADRPDKKAPDPDDPNAGQALNILVLGSDQRGGDNGHEVAGVEGMRSDTTVLVHISADRSRVEMISIPRDSRVDVPACDVTGGKTTAPMNTRFNAAFANGAMTGGDIDSAAACTTRTLESLTDVFVDGFVVVDFAGFQDMIDALGGVDMCIPEAIDNPKADLKLAAGDQTLDGKDALGFARARYGIGDGSDLSRIGRQQELMAAMTRGALGKNMLTDLSQLYGFVDAGTKSLTMSDNIASIPSLAGLAFSLKDARSGNITFMTVPIATDPQDPNTVVWTSDADELWAKVRDDKPIAEQPEAQPASDSADAGSDASTDGSGDSDASADDSAAGDDGSDAEPEPQQTKDPGKESFSAADSTATC